MKTKRFLLAAAITLAAGACSADVTAPEPALRADEAAAALEAVPTATPPAPTEPVEGDGGYIGSGVGR
ncbi:MAG TPA: hypothetical protein VFT45_02790 [Longimicrobium sp.]|nr:hypothetical protein [Longimicrobium sp.]